MCCSMIYEANERPRHATATVAIRSKPIAPGGQFIYSNSTSKPYIGLTPKNKLMKYKRQIYPQSSRHKLAGDDA